MNLWQKYKKGIAALMLFATLTLFSSTYLAYPKQAEAGALANLPYLSALSAIPIAGPSLTIGASIMSYNGGKLSALIDPVIAAAGTVFYAFATGLAVISRTIYVATTYATNFLINYSLSNISDSMSTVNTMWVLIRDFANLSLIFIVLYISISTILGLNGANTYKMLAKVILIALLMNFSLVITNVVIDVSNVVALQFLHAIDEKGAVGTSIGNAIGISRLISNTTKVGVGTKGSWNQAIVMLGVAAFLIIAAFVLAAGAVMFLVRILKLLAVMIFSPLAFAATILPNTSKLADKWWSELTGNAFLAPAYLFVVYIALNLIKIIVTPGTVTYTDVLTGLVSTTTAIPGGSMELLMGFILSIGLLTSASTAAHMASSETAKSGSTLASFAFGTGVGGVAATGRRFGGQMGESLYNRYADDKSTFGNFARGVGDNMRKGTWDFRNQPGVGSVLAVAGGQAGVDTSKGIIFNDAKTSAGGYQKEQADIKTKEKAVEKERLDTVRRLETQAITKKLKDISVLTKEIPDYSVMSMDRQERALNEKIQEYMKKLNQDEQTSLAEGNLPHILRNLTNRGAIKAHSDKLDTNEQLALKSAIMANTINKEGQKYYAEENKREKEEARQAEELAISESFATFFANKKAAGITPTPAEINVQLNTLKSPKTIVNVVQTLRENPEVASQLQNVHLTAMLNEHLSGSGKVNLQDMKYVVANADTESAKQLLAGPMRDQFPS